MLTNDLYGGITMQVPCNIRKNCNNVNIINKIREVQNAEKMD